MDTTNNFTELEIEECNAILKQDTIDTNFYILEGSEYIEDMVVPLDLNKLFAI